MHEYKVLFNSALNNSILKHSIHCYSMSYFVHSFLYGILHRRPGVEGESRFSIRYSRDSKTQEIEGRS